MTSALFFVLPFVLLILGSQGQANNQRQFDGYKVVRATVSNVHQFNFLAILRDDDVATWDFWSGPELGRFADIMASPSQLPILENFLTGNGIPFTVFIEDVQSLVVAEREALARANGSDMNWTQYHRLDTIYAWLDDLQSANPDRVEVINIGKSTEGRDLKVVKISSGGSGEKPAVWIDGTIHAREWISTSTVTYTINQLVNNASYFENLLNQVDFYILPVVNPDGYEYCHTTDRMWRKTRSVNAGSSCVGSDCNRNFGFHWGEEGASSNPCSETFSGSEAFSEPEAVAVRDYVLDNTNVDWRAFITVHSYSQLWMTPWGYTEDFPADYEEMMRVANKAVAVLKSFYGTEYETGTSANVLYKSAGTSRDWAKGVRNVDYVYTVELRDTGRYGFVLPPDQILPTGEETFAGFIVVAEEVAAAAAARKL